MRRSASALLLIATLLGPACSSNSSSPASPTPLDLTGTFAGDIVVQGIAARMVWTLVQTGTAISGTALVTQANGIVLLNGIVAGSVSGTTVTYSITVNPGGIPALPACSGQLGGTATATRSAPFTLTGTFNLLSSTCVSPLTSGSFVLTRL